MVNDAERVENAMSQCNINVTPIPVTVPYTPAMTMQRQRKSARMKVPAAWRLLDKLFFPALRLASRMSMPAVKVRPPGLAVSTIMRVRFVFMFFSSSSIVVALCLSSREAKRWYKTVFMALRDRGRLS